MRRRLAMVGSEDAVVRLVRQVHAERRMFPGVPEPSLEQIAMVLHALADHTMINDALAFDADDDIPWSLATSVGRFLHAYGDRMSEAAMEAE